MDFLMARQDGGNVGTNLPPLIKHLHNFVTLQSHTVISFQCITLKLGNLRHSISCVDRLSLTGPCQKLK